MMIKLQATGYAPVGYIVKDECFSSTQMLEGDKRGVGLRMWETSQGFRWVVELSYITSWGTERTFVRVSDASSAEFAAEWVRTASKSILPPGAGFPATPAFETRQSKLAGMMETLTLVALSDVLGQIDKDNTT